MSLLADPVVGWGEVRKGRRSKPDRIFFYSVEKFGKTSFAAGSPRPIFLDFEDGTAEFDGIESFDMREAGKDRILETLDLILAAPQGHQTVVLDTLDSMERGIQKEILREANVQTIGEVDGGYGAGYVRASEAMSSIMRKLDELRESGLGVIVLAHSGIVTFDNPLGANYKRYEPKLEKRSMPIPKEWADVILFGMFEDSVVNTDRKNTRGKGVGGKRRVLHTVRSAAWDAGNRYGLPAKLVLTDDPSESYAVYAKARESGRASSEKMLAEMESLLPRVVDNVERAAIRTWIESRKENPAAVLAGLNRLREKVEATSAAADDKNSKKAEPAKKGE
jgi:hypothetical protein